MKNETNFVLCLKPFTLSGHIQQMTSWWHFSYFSQKTEFDISCKLSPLETICMKCQILFSGKNRKNVSKYHLLKILPIVLSIHIRSFRICGYPATVQWTYNRLWLSKVLTLKEPSKTVADDNIHFSFFFNYFSEKARLDISCELSARQTIHMKCQTLFEKYEKWNVNSRMSTTAVVSGTLTQCSRETRKRVFGKQCRPRSDATEHGVSSGSPLFANSLAIFL